MGGDPEARKRVGQSDSMRCRPPKTADAAAVTRWNLGPHGQYPMLEARGLTKYTRPSRPSRRPFRCVRGVLGLSPNGWVNPPPSRAYGAGAPEDTVLGGEDTGWLPIQGARLVREGTCIVSHRAEELARASSGSHAVRWPRRSTRARDLRLQDDRYAQLSAFSKGMRKKILVSAATVHETDNRPRRACSGSTSRP